MKTKSRLYIASISFFLPPTPMLFFFFLFFLNSIFPWTGYCGCPGQAVHVYLCYSAADGSGSKVTQLFLKALHSVPSKSHLENLISPLVHAAIVLPVRERL